MNTTHCCGAVFYMVLLDLHCLHSLHLLWTTTLETRFSWAFAIKLLFWGGGPSLVFGGSVLYYCCRG